MVGTTISHYKVLEKIGEGGMGEVFLARDLTLDRKVALKFLPEELQQDPTARKRLLREAKSAAALDHPYICKIYEVGEAEDKSFISMEYIQGETLRDRLAEGPLSVKEALQKALEVAEALEGAHKQNIVHRDLKPSNIMLTPESHVKVMDFGLAKRFIPAQGTEEKTMSQPLTKTGMTPGTPSYMSPEQIRAKTVDTRSDVFSFGILLYEMLTGVHPFRRSSPMDTVSAILNDPPPPLSRYTEELPELLQHTVRKILAKDPNHRYQSIHEVRTNLNELLFETSPRDGVFHQEEELSSSKPSRSQRLKAALEDIAEKSSEVLSQEIRSIEALTVGRSEELAVLQAGFESAITGKGRLMCVTGEPGMGKTTLVEKFIHERAADGTACIIARGRSSERLAGTEGYLPLLEALEDLSQKFGPSFAEVLELSAPTWFVEVTPSAASEISDKSVIVDAKARSQERMKREMSIFLEQISEIRPMILVLEDLHWADISTIDVLAHIGSKCGSIPVLVIVTYRPADLLLSENEFERIKLDLQAKGLCREISLGFLSPEHIESYLEHEFSGHGFPEEFAELIHARTEGNPLFVVDLVRNLRDRGVVSKNKDGWTLRQSIPDVRSELPESLLSLIQRKLGQLPDGDSKLLALAAVQGGEFDSAVVAKILAIDTADVEDRLKVLENVYSFVTCIEEKEFPDGSLTTHYRFAHVLYQNALYDSLSASRRAALSLSVAEALLGVQAGEDSNVASELAFLLEVGRDFARASDYFLMAGQKAVQVAANQEAVVLFKHAIANAEKLQNDERRSRILRVALSLGQLHSSMSPPEAVNDFALAEKMARESGNTEAEIKAICGQGMAEFFLYRLAEAEKHGKRAQELAHSVNSDVGAASSEVVLGAESLASGHLIKAGQYFHHAIPILQEKGCPTQVMQGVLMHGLQNVWELDYERANATLSWAMDRATEHGAVLQIVMNQFFLTMLLGNQGKLSEALDLVQKAKRFSELHSNQKFLCRIVNTQGWLYRELQDVEAALPLDEESVQIAQEAGETHVEANAQLNIAHDYCALGDMEQSFQHLQEAEKLKQDIWYHWRFGIRLNAEKANYLIACSDLDRARSCASESLQEAKKAKIRKYISWAHKLLGDIDVLEERVEEARTHFGAALGILEGHPCPILEWKILSSAADLAKQLKDVSTSEELAARRQTVIQSLADSTEDEGLRRTFLSSKAVKS